jgi:hypothetical protein
LFIVNAIVVDVNPSIRHVSRKRIQSVAAAGREAQLVGPTAAMEGMDSDDNNHDDDEEDDDDEISDDNHDDDDDDDDDGEEESDDNENNDDEEIDDEIVEKFICTFNNADYDTTLNLTTH